MTKKQTAIIRILVFAIAIEILAVSTSTITKSNNKYNIRMGVIDDKSYNFIISNFGNCQTPIEAAKAIDDFACHNFKYEMNFMNSHFQNFNIQSFIDNGYSGVCFQFGSFFYSAMKVLIDYHEWENTNVYILDLHHPDLSRCHTFNYLVVNNEVFRIDITFDVTDFKNCRFDLFQGLVPIKSTDMKTDALNYDNYDYIMRLC